MTLTFARIFRSVSIYGASGLFCCGLSLLYWSKNEQIRYSNLKWQEFDSKPKNLVITGPYSMSRNPVYLSYITMTLSFGVLSLHRIFPHYYPYSRYVILPLIIPTSIVYAFFLLVVKYEEHRLKLRFGVKYFRYTQSVNRWIGFHQSIESQKEVPPQQTMPEELTTTYLVEIINITALMLLIEREDYGLNTGPIQRNIRGLLWIVYICLLSCFGFHLLDIPYGWYVLARVYSVIFIFLNLTICYALMVSMRIKSKLWLYILLLLSFIASFTDWMTENQYTFIYLINVLVSLYTLYLIGSFKIKVYDQSNSEIWRKSQSFSLDAVQRIECFVGLLNIIIFSVQYMYKYHLFSVKASVHIIYFLKMYLIILSWKDMTSSNQVNQPSQKQISC